MQRIKNGNVQSQYPEQLNKIEGLFQDGYEKEFTDLCGRLEAKKENHKLPKKLQDKLKKIGNTPVDEPKLWQTMQDIDSKGLDILEMCEIIFEDIEEMDEFQAEDIYFFAGAVSRKIKNYKDEDGNFKVTENTKDFTPLKPSKQLKFARDLRTLITKKADTEAQQKKWLKDLEKFSKSKIKECGLNPEAMTDWEIGLVTEMIKEGEQGYIASALGKR